MNWCFIIVVSMLLVKVTHGPVAASLARNAGSRLPPLGPVSQNLYLYQDSKGFLCSLKLKKHTAPVPCVGYASLSAIDVCLKVVFERPCCRWNHVSDPSGAGAAGKAPAIEVHVL